MASSVSPSQQSGSQPSRLKLVMPSISDSQERTTTDDREFTSTTKESSGSPTRPSYSPVTPTLPQSGLALGPATGNSPSRNQWMDQEPEPPSMNLDDNSDAIALRAAISVLQMQRQQTLKDIRNLDKMKKAALQNPHAFAEDINSGKLTSMPNLGVNVDSDDSDEDMDHSVRPESSRFGKLPSAQNVVRAPPIEWAKYRIVGEPLNRLHEVQQHYPGWTENTADASQPPQLHEIAAPYRPFKDKLDEP